MFGQGNIAANLFVLNGNFHNLFIIRYRHRELLFTEHEAFRLLDFSKDPVAHRNIIKPEGTILRRNSGHQGSIFCEFFRTRRKQANQGAFQSFAVFTCFQS